MKNSFSRQTAGGCLRKKLALAEADCRYRCRMDPMRKNLLRTLVVNTLTTPKMFSLKKLDFWVRNFVSFPPWTPVLLNLSAFDSEPG